MTIMKKTIICLYLTGILVGCSTAAGEISGFEKSTVNKEVPVPSNAIPGDAHFDNPHINKGKRYHLDNIGGDQGLYPPQEYFEEIKNWGWEELEKEQMGHVHFFKKGETIISIVLEEDYFQLYEIKEEFDF
ncbi:hypothetical protein F9U64_17870 [Gracilibacillus oryzae]|uniref:Lipoprotein n=1 Tax=Gracilibacillus oryzae TaxID=1672701 RepID=A0A7C8KWH8_9BACI|nr:hypothetical protein [Gracilibacillus oryzae]KAB8127379.1 hypothetical protein F9U64_17870 [Gracilibacillus oryzae]